MQVRARGIPQDTEAPRARCRKDLTSAHYFDDLLQDRLAALRIEPAEVSCGEILQRNLGVADVARLKRNRPFTAAE